ncbi:hypothetical protein [Fulvimarina sp. MAC8]|uniref:hypothetical protein n=1 Tax=Fulvimarina sp. MAC8 TaxID=3162874 RepID=UPI0032EF7D61
MKLLDFLTLVTALGAAMTIVMHGLYDFNFPVWRFAYYETAFMMVLAFSCFFQFARAFSRLGSKD